MASRSPSTVSATEGDSSYMSRYSDTTSNLGRLRIGAASSSTSGEMKTRSQTEKEKHRQSSSRAPAQSTRKPAAPKTPTASSSRRQPARESTSKRRQPASGKGSASDEDDDDDDQDDSSDDGDNGPPGTPSQRPSPEALRRVEVLLIMSANDPSLLGPTEFVTANAQQVPTRSRPYRRIAETMASRLVTDNNDLALLRHDLSLTGAEWGNMIATNVQNRTHNAVSTFQHGAQGDALDTIREFRRIYDSVNNILRHPMLANMHGASKTSLILTLVWILSSIVHSNRDIRGANAPVYAGGSGQHEHNLFQRFAFIQTDWPYFVNEILRGLIALPNAANHFREQGVVDSLRRTWAGLVPLVRQYPNIQSVQGFGQAIRSILISLNIPTTG